MFSNLDITFLLQQQPKTLFTFALGLLTIVLFAKDKFNVPTHDKILMGPFAQLPPQSLTIDSRYKWGLFVYLSLLIGLYIAITIIGIMTAGSFDFMGLIQGSGINSSSALTQTQLENAKPANSEIWPMIAATFIISTGTAGDSILGRIELYVRQYAHKSAYIPSAVSELAFNLRNVALDPWLVSNREMKTGEFEQRKAALSELTGSVATQEFAKSLDREGEVAAWMRANVLFYSLQQIFNDNIHNVRLDNLADADDYKSAFEQFQSSHAELLARFSDATKSSDQFHREVQKFSRETSFTMATLLLQAARNTSELNAMLTNLGFQALDTRDQSDHFGYVSSVILSIIAGAVLSAIIFLVPSLFKLMNWTDPELQQGAVAIISGLVLYLVMFRVLDYSRDKFMDTQNWSESFGGYMKTTLSCSIFTTAISVVLLVLILTICNWVKYVAYSLTAFFWLVAFQEMLAAIGTMFGLLHLRQAARLPRSRLELLVGSVFGVALLHACVAAILVCFIDKLLFVQTTANNNHVIYEQIRKDFTALNSSPQLLSVYPLADRNQIAVQLTNFKTLWDGDKYEDPQIKSQLVDLSVICKTLNKQPASKLLKASGSAGGLDVDADVLFQKADVCMSVIPVDDRGLKSQQGDDQSVTFSRLVSSVGLLYGNIQASGVGQESKKANYLAWMFPTCVTFLLAYAFGVGLRFSRSHWLRSEIDREDGQGVKLRELIAKQYNNSLDFEKCLIFPIAVLGYVTPLEALRYEDLRIKLFGKIQGDQIKWVDCEVTPGVAENQRKAAG
jgi:hypothetical protein